MNSFRKMLSTFCRPSKFGFFALAFFTFPLNLNANTPFLDVTPDLLFSPSIDRFQSQNLIIGDTFGGQPTGTLRPKDQLQRDEFTKVAVIVRLLEEGNTKLLDKSLDIFTLSLHTLLQPYYSVSSSNGAKKFTDIKDKDIHCAKDPNGCNPWHSQYINYASSKGMIKGYGNYFKPEDPILRIHGLKLAITSNGNSPLASDSKYQELLNDPRIKYRQVKCLAGAEPYILENNGGNNEDSQKLLSYALLADKLDIFGNNCQAFKANSTAKDIADHLQEPLQRQEIARYFSLSTTTPELQLNPGTDPTVDDKGKRVMSYVVGSKQTEEKPALPNDYKSLSNAENEGKISAYAEVEEVENYYTNRSKAEMSIAELTFFSKQGRCCKTKNLSPEYECKKIQFSKYNISEESDYNWETYSGPVWHKATRGGSSCWVPFSDILEPEYLTASIPANEYGFASAPTYENCGNAEECYAQGLGGPFLPGFPQTKQEEDMPWIYTADYYGNHKDSGPAIQSPIFTFEPIVELEYTPEPDWIKSDPLTDFVMSTGGWITDNVGKPIAEISNEYVVIPVVQTTWELEGAAYSVGNTITSTWETVTHPVETVTGIYDAVTHIPETAGALWNNAVDTNDKIARECEPSDRDCFIEKGTAKGEVIQWFIPVGAGAKATLQTARGSRLASIINKIAPIKKIQFDTKMQVVANKYDADFKVAPIKRIEEARRKGGRPEDLKDLVRGTYYFDDLNDLYKNFDNIKSEYNIVSVNDRINSPMPSGYRDINMVAKDPVDGFLTEVRVTTKGLMEAGDKEHGIYEITRQFKPDNKSAINKNAINEAVEKLKKEHPETYNNIKKDLDDIVEHVESGAKGIPEEALKELKIESQAILKEAWEKELNNYNK